MRCARAAVAASPGRFQFGRVVDTGDEGGDREAMFVGKVVGCGALDGFLGKADLHGVQALVQVHDHAVQAVAVAGLHRGGGGSRVEQIVFGGGRGGQKSVVTGLDAIGLADRDVPLPVLNRPVSAMFHRWGVLVPDRGPVAAPCPRCGYQAVNFTAATIARMVTMTGMRDDTSGA